ncbi:MAG: XRE family transcriptional regulator [Lentisphaeria bacterium]|nr:XRE family transcriptional regulator [Lentisphaeria bacterium]MBR2910217.1 XRE family transcriptional regulator [Lentisphaeria bacterium]
MIKSPLAITLGEEIRRYMRQRKITQRFVAEKIFVSANVLSQMLRGSFLFSGKQLDAIIELLKPEPAEAENWRKINDSLQNGLSSSTQGRNTYWRTLRENRGLTLPALSNLTGLMTSRLSYIESVGADDPSRYEEDVLRKVYELSDSGRRSGEDISSPEENGIPLIYLDDLRAFERNTPFSELVYSRARETAFWEVYHNGCVCAVLADCRRLQMNFPGFAFLVVAERSKSESHVLELCLDRKDNFFLREKREGKWQPAKFLIPDAVCVSPKWRLQVLDVVIKPFDLTLGV